MAFSARNLFNHTTTHLVGGVGPDQVDGIVADLTGGQQMLRAIDLLTNNLRDASAGWTHRGSSTHQQTQTGDTGAHDITNQLSTVASAGWTHRGSSTHQQTQTGDTGAHDIINQLSTVASAGWTHRGSSTHQQTQTGDTGAHDITNQLSTVASAGWTHRGSSTHQQTQTGDTGAHDITNQLSTVASAGWTHRGSSTHQATQSQPAQPPTQTQTGNTGAHDVSPPSEAQPPTTSQPVSLTHTTTAIHSSYDGQVIENLDIYVDNGDALTITNDNVTLRNVRVHHAEGNGVVVSGANNVTIENVEVINSSPPTGNQDETSDNINNILVADSPNVTVHNATLRGGSDGLNLVNSPGANISHVDGYDFHTPDPEVYGWRGSFVEFNGSGNSTLTDFYVLNNAATSASGDNVAVYNSPNVTISNGVIDGNNSTAGVGIMFEAGSTGGQVHNVDAIHMGNGAFGTWDTANNVVFDDTRSFDNIHADQGRGPSESNAVIWVTNSPGVSILNSTYTDPGNPNNIVWQGQPATVADVHEAPNATPMEHIVNHYAWS